MYMYGCAMLGNERHPHQRDRWEERGKVEYVHSCWLMSVALLSV